MVLLAVNSFTQALWRQSLASYLLMMVLCLCLQDDYHSKLVYAKEAAAESAAAVTAAGAVPTAPFAFHSSGRLEAPMRHTSLHSSVSSMGTTSLAGASSRDVTKKPKSSGRALPYREALAPQALLSAVAASTAGEPTFEASTEVGPDHPCYNFTIGNDNLKEFYSPNYPNSYLNNTECQRVIRAPFGYQIKIEFRDQFHLEDATNCEYDFLEVRDGAFGYSTSIDKLCGPDFPRDIVSSDRFLFLRFVSDDSIQYSGFRAVYSFIQNQNERPEPPGECRFNKTGVSGVVDQKEIPAELNNYSISQDVPLDCMWNITVAPGYKMYINFKRYKLSIPNNCEANYIDIYEDKLSDKDRKHRFCGTQAEPFKSTSTNINIRYFARKDALILQANQPTTLFGFEITFTAFREVHNKEKCSTTEFDCEDSTCIDASLKCDGVDNCKYRYDEDKTNTCAENNQGVLNLSSHHMVVILIVFCALVFGMCASITISCWSKIEERRQRKREYKLRRSRETSMEVGLDRTMTITSLDRSTGGCVLEHPDQASSSSGSRCRKIITANAIRHKSDQIIDDDGLMVDPGMNVYYDSEENGCYVPDMEIASMHHHQAPHHHLVYPPSAERRPKQGLQSNGGTLCSGHHLDSGEKYSPDTPTPPQMMLGSPNGGGGGQSPLVAGEYYSHTQSQLERDSLRSGSECSIPPPPPPPALSHFRNRMQQQQQQQYRTLPLDASKLPTEMMMMSEPNQQTLPYRHPQHMQQQRMGSGPITLTGQQVIMHHPGQAQSQGQQHHPDCAVLHPKLQSGLSDPGYNSGTLRRSGYYGSRPTTANSNRQVMEGNGGQSGNEMHNDDVDEGIIDEADESVGGVNRSTMELNDEVMEEDMLTDNDLYPSSNGRLPAQMIHHPGQQQHYLLRGQSTLEEEDDSATSVPLTNSNAGYGSGSQHMTPSHRQPFYRSEAVIEMAAPDSVPNHNGANSNAIRQGVAIMR